MKVLLIKPLPENYDINKRFNRDYPVGSVFKARGTVNNPRPWHSLELPPPHNMLFTLLPEEQECFKELK